MAPGTWEEWQRDQQAGGAGGVPWARGQTAVKLPAEGSRGPAPRWP